MKILFVGDSPTVSTGFSCCTREVCRELHSAGHTVTVLGLGYHGDPHTYPYSIYPCISPYEGAHTYFGEERLPILVARLSPDVIIILQDEWNIKAYFHHLDEVKKKCDEESIPYTIPPVIGWIAVDSKNQKAESLNRLAHLVVWTKFAATELVKGGYTGSHSIVPCGVDLSLFYPRDKVESRREIFGDSIPLDSYIIGVIGRNQPRKRPDLTIQYFAEWVHRYNVSNAYLYLHVAPTGERSCDIRSLIRYHDIRGRVIINEPDVGTGNDASLIPKIYSSLDLHMTQSQAEGFHLPTLEAMACGVACLVPDHSAFSLSGGWCRDAVARVPCTSTALTAPLNSYPYTIGEIPDRKETISALQCLYLSVDLRREYGQRGLHLAKRMSWGAIAKMFRTVVEQEVVK